MHCFVYNKLVLRIVVVAIMFSALFIMYLNGTMGLNPG